RRPFPLHPGTSAVPLGRGMAVPGARRPEGHAHAAAARADAGQRRDGRSVRLLAYGTGFTYVFGLGSVLAFLPAYAADRGLSPSSIGLVVSTYWVARLTASLGVGRLSDLWGRGAILVGALLTSAAGGGLVAGPPGTRGAAS